MESIEYIRALIPLSLLAVFTVIKRYKEHVSKHHVGMKTVQLSLMGMLISWFSISISLVLFTQLLIDSPSSLYMTLFVFIILISLAMICLQHLSLQVFFNDEGLAIRSLFGKTKYCDFAAVLEVEEKRYAGEGGSRK